MPDNPIRWREFPYAPFINPLPPPEVDPDEPDLICVQFNKTYLPYMIGALRTLIFSDMWEGEDVNGLAPARFQTLIGILQKATEECPPCKNDCDDCDDCAGDCPDCEDC